MTKQKHLVASGIATSYWEYGSPAHPTLVLLHGLKGSHGGLGPLIRELKDWHIIAPDLPNHGLSGDIDSPHGMTELTDWLIAFVQALGLDAPPHIAGHSFGGMLAMQALARQPELSSKLVLIVPVTRSSRFLKFFVYPVSSLVSYLPFGLQKAVMRLWLIRAISCRLNIVSPTDDIWDFQMNQEVMDAKYCRLSTLGVFRIAAEREDFYCLAEHITTPTLVIAAARDRFNTTLQQKRLAQAFAHGRLVIIPNVGHFLTIENPQAVAAAMEL